MNHQPTTMITTSTPILLAAVLLATASGSRLQNGNNTDGGTEGGGVLQQIRSTLQSRANNNTFAIQRVLSTNCGQFIQRAIQQQQQQQQQSNYTIFLPTDQAFGSLSPLIRSGAFMINCRSQQQQQDQNNTACQSNPFIQLATQNRGSLSSLIACVPELLKYQIVPNNTLLFASQQSGQSNATSNNPFSNINVVETALNSTAFVNMNGTAQVLVFNSTNNGTFVTHGYGRPARIVGPAIDITAEGNRSSQYNMTRGTIMLVDSVLIPPFPLNVTLQMYNLTDFANSISNNNTNNSTAGITVFAPLNSTSDGNTTDVNRYIIPDQVLYANSTTPTQLNVTNANNETVPLQLDSASGQLMYGNVTVVVANIPVAEGVLHILNSTLPASTGGMNTTGTGGIGASITSGAASITSGVGGFVRRARQ